MAEPFTDIKTLVVKIGTTLLSGEHGFEGLLLEEVVKDLSALKRETGMNLLIVSSGAMGCGMDRLGLTERPTLLPLKQATAAVGQSRLMHIYEALFQTYGQGLRTAQVLLSANDLDNRKSYLNLRNTINALFDFETVVPIVNENDSTTPDELRFGDNDTLAAKVASKIGADLFIILSNVDGLYDADPGSNPDAKLIEHVDEVTADIESMATDTTVETSIGGMRTKLSAAKIACTSGMPMVIANGHRPNVIRDVLQGAIPMTVFGSAATALPHRKRWIAFGRTAKGVVRVDDGARDALLNRGTSLLAVGVIGAEGGFDVGEAVEIEDAEGRPLARGLSNYSCNDLRAIMGLKSGDIREKLGYKDFDEVIHRNNLVLL